MNKRNGKLKEKEEARKMKKRGKNKVVLCFIQVSCFWGFFLLCQDKVGTVQLQNHFPCILLEVTSDELQLFRPSWEFVQARPSSYVDSIVALLALMWTWPSHSILYFSLAFALIVIAKANWLWQPCLFTTKFDDCSKNIVFLFASGGNRDKAEFSARKKSNIQTQSRWH